MRSVTLACSNTPLSYDLNRKCCSHLEVQAQLQDVRTLFFKDAGILVAMPTTKMDKEFKITKHLRCTLPPDLC